MSGLETIKLKKVSIAQLLICGLEHVGERTTFTTCIDHVRARYFGETVNRGIVDINQHIRFVLGERGGMVSRGKQ